MEERKQEDKDLESLIERARRRDEAALSELFRVHSRRLLESVRAELGDRVRQRLESRDVMQQVYLDALAAIDRFEDRGRDSFIAWLRRIAVNRIRDVDRRSFKTVKRGGEVRAADLGRDASMARLLGDVAASQTSPSMAAHFSERVLLLEGALEKLTADQREAIRLRYMNQLSVAKTAEKMNRSENAIRTLCVRALLRLRELFGDAL